MKLAGRITDISIGRNTEGTYKKIIENIDVTDKVRQCICSEKIKSFITDNFCLENQLAYIDSEIYRDLRTFLNTRNAERQYAISLKRNNIDPEKTNMLFSNGESFVYRNGILSEKSATLLHGFGTTYKSCGKNIDVEARKLKRYNPIDYNVLGEFVRTVKDNNGNPISKVYLKQSCIEGVFDIVERKADGSINFISRGFKDPITGETVVKQNFELDGIKSAIRYNEDKFGNRSYSYKIVDNDGNILMDETSKFRIIDDNNFESERNGNKYKISYIDGRKTFKVENLSENITEYIEINTNSKDIINLLKYSGAETLLAYKKSRISNIDVDEETFMNARACANMFRHIVLGKGMTNSKSVLWHEMGHLLDVDFRRDLESFYTNKDLVNIFQKEYKNFLKISSTFEQEKAEYYLHDFGKTQNEEGAPMGLSELISDVHSLRNGVIDINDEFIIRITIAQQYFPRTIAKINELYNLALK